MPDHQLSYLSTNFQWKFDFHDFFWYPYSLWPQSSSQRRKKKLGSDPVSSLWLSCLQEAPFKKRECNVFFHKNTRFTRFSAPPCPGPTRGFSLLTCPTPPRPAPQKNAPPRTSLAQTRAQTLYQLNIFTQRGQCHLFFTVFYVEASLSVIILLV